MKLSSGVLADAEARAARLWGADFCRFSVGGATHANQAVALALGGDGDEVVVSRTLHRSMLLGLVLAGLTPVWVRPDVDPATGLPLGVPPAAVAEALDAAPARPGRARRRPVVRRHGRRRRGTRRGGPRPRRTPGRRRRVGGALRLPPGPAPARARSSARTRWWSARTRRCRRGARPRWCSPVPTGSTPRGWTPPSRPATPPARPARCWRAPMRPGPCSSATARRCSATPWPPSARPATRLADVDGLVVLDGPGVDPLKLTLVLPGTGADGNAVEADLLAEGLPVEAAERDTLVAQVSLADTAATLARLTDALVASLGRRRGAPRAVVTAAAYAVEPVTDLSPRAAFFAAAETVPDDRRRRPGQRRAGRAVPARHPRPRARRAGDRGRCSPPWTRRAGPGSGSPTPPTRPWPRCGWCADRFVAGGRDTVCPCSTADDHRLPDPGARRRGHPHGRERLRPAVAGLGVPPLRHRPDPAPLRVAAALAAVTPGRQRVFVAEHDGVPVGLARWVRPAAVVARRPRSRSRSPTPGRATARAGCSWRRSRGTRARTGAETLLAYVAPGNTRVVSWLKRLGRGPAASTSTRLTGCPSPRSWCRSRCGCMTACRSASSARCASGTGSGRTPLPAAIAHATSWPSSSPAAAGRSRRRSSSTSCGVGPPPR